MEYQCILEDVETIFINENYRLRRKFNGGSHGEVWRAIKEHVDANGDTHQEIYILKRMFLVTLSY